jgi:hypothetical protein
LNAARRNSPGTNTEAVEDLAGELIESNFTARIGSSVENSLDRTLWQLIAGDIELSDLTPALAAWWTTAQWFGHGSRQVEVNSLIDTADRLYTEMTRRPGVRFVDPNRSSYADLERLRGNAEHADQIDAQNAARFSEVTK